VVKVWKLWEKCKEGHISADDVSGPLEHADQERLKILTRLYDGVRRFNLAIDSSTVVEDFYHAVSDLQLCCMRAISETESAVSRDPRRSRAPLIAAALIASPVSS
jgi:hypothetical protein